MKTITVKELIEVLQACNQDAEVVVETGAVLFELYESQVFASTRHGENRVYLDVAFGEESDGTELEFDQLENEAEHRDMEMMQEPREDEDSDFVQQALRDGLEDRDYHDFEGGPDE